MKMKTPTPDEFEQFLRTMGAEMEMITADLYSIYCEKVGGKAFNGDALPLASEFLTDPSKKKQADAWRAVAKHAITMFLTMLVMKRRSDER